MRSGSQESRNQPSQTSRRVPNPPSEDKYIRLPSFGKLNCGGVHGFHGRPAAAAIGQKLFHAGSRGLSMRTTPTCLALALLLGVATLVDMRVCGQTAGSETTKSAEPAIEQRSRKRRRKKRSSRPMPSGESSFPGCSTA